MKYAGAGIHALGFRAGLRHLLVVCVTLGRSVTFLSLHFCTCKMKKVPGSATRTCVQRSALGQVPSMDSVRVSCDCDRSSAPLPWRGLSPRTPGARVLCIMGQGF